MSQADRELPPPEFLQLAGHPLRWRLLGELARSDRTVHEMTGLVGQPQNLVSYHLGKLRDARLVSARRSSADRRDAYYTVDLARLAEMLSATGGALHPGLRLVPPPPSGARPGAVRARVLFLCTGNSARSQMAEALARVRSGGVVEAHSAGSHPKPLHANAVRAMRDEHGIDLTGQRSKHLSVFAQQRFDRVISLCDRVREVCPEFPGCPETIHWSIPDPAVGDDEASYPAFQQTADELETRIKFLLATLAAPNSPGPDDNTGGAMTEPTEMVNVRYMVDDVDTAIEFYTKHLGFEVRTSAAPAFADVTRGNLRLLLSGPASSAGRPMPDGTKPGPGGWNRIHLIVTDITAEVARLRDAGASFRNDVVTGPGGSQILLEDPAGNVIELFQPAGP